MTEPPAPLVPLLAAGWTALARYTGTLLALFAAQLVLAAATLFSAAHVLASAFARLPYFDRAVDGDLAAWVYLAKNHREVLAATGWLGLGGVVAWLAASWFLAGGALGVLAERPDGRANTARAFGAGGASGFLPLLRLSLLTLPSYLLVSIALGVGLDAVAPRLEYALSLSQLLGYLVLGATPALLLLHLAWTITDYARAELVLRRDSHDLSAWAAYGRAISFVLRRPRTLLHSALGWLAIGGVAIAYAVAAHGHPMAGTNGALALFVVRQGVVLAQLAIRFAVQGGQVALVRQRPAPALEQPERRRA